MNTSQKRSGTTAERTIVGAQSAEVSKFTNFGPTHLTYTFQTSGLKSRESLQPRIDALWRTFCEQAQSLISDSYSNETTGPLPSIPSGIPTGRQNTAASGTSGSRFRSVGPS